MAFDFQVLGSAVSLTPRTTVGNTIPTSPSPSLHLNKSSTLLRASQGLHYPKSNILASKSTTGVRPSPHRKPTNAAPQFYLQSRKLAQPSQTSKSLSSFSTCPSSSSSTSFIPTTTPSSESESTPFAPCDTTTSTHVFKRVSNAAPTTTCSSPDWIMESMDTCMQSPSSSRSSSPVNPHRPSTPKTSIASAALSSSVHHPHHHAPSSKSLKSVGTSMLDEAPRPSVLSSNFKTSSSGFTHSGTKTTGFYDYKHLKSQTIRRNKEQWNIEEVILRRLRYLVDNSSEMSDQIHSLLMSLENSDLPVTLLQQYFPTLKSTYDLRVQLEYYFIHVQPTTSSSSKDTVSSIQRPNRSLSPTKQLTSMETPLALLKLVERYHPIPDKPCYPMMFQGHMHPSLFHNLPLTIT